MRTVLLAAEVVGTTLLMLALAAPPAWGQSLAETTAATGIHGTLSRQSLGSGKGALGTVKNSLAKSTKAKDPGGFGSSSSGGKSRSRSGASFGGGAGGRGCWVTASTGGKGSTSSAWLRGGSGWNSGGGRSSGSRRPRS